MWKETIYFVTLKVWALVSEKTKERSCLEVLNRTSGNENQIEPCWFFFI